MANNSDSETFGLGDGPTRTPEEGRNLRVANFKTKLNDPEWRATVKVILVLGAAGSGKSNLLKLITGYNDVEIGHTFKSDLIHKTPSGTSQADPLLGNLNGEYFLFIDTPGFGCPDIRESVVISKIRNLLGFCTRAYGGIHGFIYVQDITSERTSPGMQDSLTFLNGLRVQHIIPPIIFVTTKWDRFPEFERPKYVAKLNELKTVTWKDFDSHGYIEIGISCDSYPEDIKLTERIRVGEVISNLCSDMNIGSLKMPFWEWTWAELGSAAFGIAAVGAGGTLAAMTIEVWFPVAVVGVAVGALVEEAKRGRLRVVMTVDEHGNTNVMGEHDSLGRTPWGSSSN